MVSTGHTLEELKSERCGRAGGGFGHGRVAFREAPPETAIERERESSGEKRRPQHFSRLGFSTPISIYFQVYRKRERRSSLSVRARKSALLLWLLLAPSLPKLEYTEGSSLKNIERRNKNCTSIFILSMDPGCSRQYVDKVLCTSMTSRLVAVVAVAMPRTLWRPRNT